MPRPTSLKRRTQSFFGPAVDISEVSSPSDAGDPDTVAAINLESIDVAAVINACTEETNFSVQPEDAANFNKKWRNALFTHFKEQEYFGGEEFLEEWLRTGKSCGRTLRLQVMALKPNEWFRIHMHPNMEFEMTLEGSLHEVKFTTAPALPVILYPEDIVVGGNEGATSTAFSVTSFPGPDLNELQETFAPLPLSFEKAEVPAGKFLANIPGSLHQSFTCEDGALVLVLWSGCHAHVRPEDCSDVKGPGSDLLKPGAGWANA